MVLGHLAMISKKGVELQEQVVELTSLEYETDRLMQHNFLVGVELDCNGIDIELTRPLPSLPIHPLSITVSGDYITGFYQDSGLATGPYRIKLWLMIEEAPQPLAK